MEIPIAEQPDQSFNLTESTKGKSIRASMSVVDVWYSLILEGEKYPVALKADRAVAKSLAGVRVKIARSRFNAKLRIVHKLILMNDTTIALKSCYCIDIGGVVPSRYNRFQCSNSLEPQPWMQFAAE